VLDLPNWLLDDVSLLPVNMIRREVEARACAPELAERLTRGELRLEVERFAFDQVGDAIAALAGGRLRGRAVLVPA
jgi:NADPH2:quinone reductase